MNKSQQLSLTAKETPVIAEMIEDGNAKTHELLGEVLSSIQGVKSNIPLSFGGVMLNREYYNLFVIGTEKFDGDSFTVAKTSSLVSAIEPDVKDKFFNIRDDSVVEQILTLPSLFMSENVDFMRSRPGQKALLGRVTELSIERNDIRLSFEADVKIFQQSITDISHSLGILGNPGCSELNNTHWTIKQVDLIGVLTENGLLNLGGFQTQQ
jgi:hypothetical protein